MGPENAGHVGVSFLWRFGQSKTGWGWHYGLNWFGTDLERSIGGPNTEFGSLSVPPDRWAATGTRGSSAVPRSPAS